MSHQQYDIYTGKKICHYGTKRFLFGNANARIRILKNSYIVIPNKNHKHDLLPLVKNNHVIVEVRRGMYGLSQHACILANAQFFTLLAKHGYTHDIHTHGVDNNTHTYIRSIIRSFKASDPNKKIKKAITPQLLAYVYTRPTHCKFSQHITDLYNGAFFRLPLV